jgi:hypothetical protein
VSLCIFLVAPPNSTPSVPLSSQLDDAFPFQSGVSPLSPEDIFSKPIIQECLNVCPHAITCSLLSDFIHQLSAHLDGNKKQSMNVAGPTITFCNTLSEKELQQALPNLQECLLFLHRCHPLYKSYDHDVCRCKDEGSSRIMLPEKNDLDDSGPRDEAESMHSPSPPRADKSSCQQNSNQERESKQASIFDPEHIQSDSCHPTVNVNNKRKRSTSSASEHQVTKLFTSCPTHDECMIS